MSTPRPSVLVTGASTGIGLGICRELISRGYRVFGSVRKQQDADRLSAELGANYHPLIFDVTDAAAVTAARKEVEALVAETGLVGLVNNAGIAIGGPLRYQSMEIIEQHFQVNVFGLMRVTKEFLPLLGAVPGYSNPPGRILNISSVAGKLSAPFVGAYAGTKHAVEGISHSLRRELMIYGIDVIIIGPGAVDTPIWDKGVDPTPYLDTEYGPLLDKFSKFFVSEGKKGLSVEFMGKRVADIFEKNKPKTRYAIVPQKFKNWSLPVRMPDRALDRVFGKQIGLSKRV